MSPAGTLPPRSGATSSSGPGPVRGTEPVLLRSPQHVDTADDVIELLRLVGGAVGTAVVDDEDVGLRQCGPCTFENVLDVLDLVVGRQHHEDAHRRRAYRPGRG